jgi:hypothetical protein
MKIEFWRCYWMGCTVKGPMKKKLFVDTSRPDWAKTQ